MSYKTAQDENPPPVKYVVRLSNSAGVLDRAYACTEEEAKEMAARMVNDLPYMDIGDSITVVAYPEER